MFRIIFVEEGWEQYTYWQTQDKKTLKKINELIKSICRSPFEGIGKPEPLKNEPSGYWSRRIDDKNRITYSVSEDSITIYTCKSHYSK
jgi:toxin YoeB